MLRDGWWWWSLLVWAVSANSAFAVDLPPADSAIDLRWQAQSGAEIYFDAKSGGWLRYGGRVAPGCQLSSVFMGGDAPSEIKPAADGSFRWPVHLDSKRGTVTLQIACPHSDVRLITLDYQWSKPPSYFRLKLRENTSAAPHFLESTRKIPADQFLSCHWQLDTRSPESHLRVGRNKEAQSFWLKQNYLRTAGEAFESNRYDQALEALSKVGSSDEAQARRLRFLRGVIALKQQQFSAAQDWFEVTPSPSLAWNYHLALALAYQGKLKEADHVLQEVPDSLVWAAPAETRTEHLAFAAQIASKMGRSSVAAVLFSRSQDWIQEEEFSRLLPLSQEAASFSQFLASPSLSSATRSKLARAAGGLRDHQPKIVEADFDLGPDPSRSSKLVQIGAELGLASFSFGRQTTSSVGMLQTLVGASALLSTDSFSADAHADLGVVTLHTSEAGGAPRFLRASLGAQYRFSIGAPVSLGAGAELEYRTFFGSDDIVHYANLFATRARVLGVWEMTSAWSSVLEFGAGPLLMKNSNSIFSNFMLQACAGVDERQAGSIEYFVRGCYDSEKFDSRQSLPSSSVLELRAGYYF